MARGIIRELKNLNNKDTGILISHNRQKEHKFEAPVGLFSIDDEVIFTEKKGKVQIIRKVDIK